MTASMPRTIGPTKACEVPSLLTRRGLPAEDITTVAVSWKRLNRDLEGCLRELIGALEMRRSRMW